NASSWYAGTTTATVLPSSMPRRLRGRSAGSRPRDGLPEQRREQAQDEADEGADDHGVTAAAGARLRRHRPRDHFALLDGQRQRQQRLRARQVLLDDSAPGLGQACLSEDQEAVRRRSALGRL